MWQRHVHSGWRFGIGVFLIVFSVVATAYYYIELAAAREVIVPNPLISSLLVATTAQPEASQEVTGKEARAEVPPSVINLRTATQSELETLPSIGPSKAQAILAYRDKNGFRSVDDLDNVKGIGAATLEKLRPLVKVE